MLYRNICHHSSLYVVQILSGMAVADPQHSGAGYHSEAPETEMTPPVRMSLIPFERNPAEENTGMSRTENLSLLSEYERFVLESLYRQAAKESGHPLGVPERKRIRDEYIASLGKDIPQTRPYRKHKKPGSNDRTFHWQPCGPMRTIRKAGE